MKHFMELVICLQAITLSGCFRYEESIEVKNDGSGSAEIILTRPDAPAGQAEAPLTAFFEARFSEAAMKRGLPAGMACDYQTAQDGDQLRTTIRYRFDSVQKFIAWAASSDTPFNNVSVVWKGRALEYSRTFRPLAAQELAVVRSSLPDAELAFKFTGPGKLGKTDAASRQGNTAVWEFKAAELLSGKTITAEFALPPPWPLYILGAAVVLVVAVLAVRKRRATVLARSANHR